jgi:hypothetical protein
MLLRSNLLENDKLATVRLNGQTGGGKRQYAGNAWVIRRADAISATEGSLAREV